MGLATGKQAVLCIASGGVYEGAMAAYDTLTPMLKTQLGFIGSGGEKAAASTAAAVAQARLAAARF